MDLLISEQKKIGVVDNLYVGVDAGDGICLNYVMLMMWNLWYCVKLAVMTVDTGIDVALWYGPDGGHLDR